MAVPVLNVLNYFLFGFSVLALVFLVYRRTRQAPTVFSWTAGLLYGLPFFPGSLLLFSFVLMGVSVFRPDLDLFNPAVFFAFNCTLLFAAGWLAVHQSVTHTHLILEPWFPGREIPIRDIRDYYFKSHGFLCRVTVIFKRGDHLHRASFTMPARYIKLFDQVIDQRIQNPGRQPSNQPVSSK